MMASHTVGTWHHQGRTQVGWSSGHNESALVAVRLAAIRPRRRPEFFDAARNVDFA